jgi:hypothetical protein
MTRKDYELIASTLNKVVILNGNTDTAITALAHALSNDNPRFDALRFVEAVYKA